MEYLEFLKRLHAAVAPRAYLEIGLRHGDSLALADCPALGVDPGFNLKVELGENVKLLRETSDEYFGRAKPLKPLGGRRVDLAFIDGMHLAEFAMRDFIGVERLAHWTGVAVFDDILPRTIEEAARDRRTRAWTGDVYKVLGVLARHRPDLICLRVGTQPTGLLLVLGLDPESLVLSARYDVILQRAVVPDPQSVPADVLERRGVLDPEQVLGSRVWPVLRDLREQEVSRRSGLRDLRRTVRRELGPVSPGRLRRLLPASA
ncbi:MAG: class I SAM-dependent methyltransferase [Solirubrobacteraceae bacterium]